MADPSLHDPFFRVVRERHPDVDIVMLPPEASPPHTESPATLDRARSVVTISQLTVTDILDEVGHPDAPVVALWSTYSRDGSRRRIVRTAITDLPEGSPVPLLREIGDALLARQWDARPYADGSPQLRGVRADLVCEARAYDHAVSLEITSVPLPLSDASAEALEEIA